MLRTGVLRVSEEEHVLRELEGRLRPFIARRVGTPADVDDVLQDVFVRMHLHLGRIRDEERLAAWLFRVARSAIADHRRARARHPLVADEHHGGEAVAPEDDVIADEALSSALTACVARCVAALPSPYREAITLTELEGVSQKDAAAMLGLSCSGMKSRVQRGRALLRRRLERACAIELDARRRITACTPRDRHTGCTPDAAC